MFRLTIQFCGILKEYAQQEQIQITIESKILAKDLKQRIISCFQNSPKLSAITTVVESSVLSDDFQILNDDFSLTSEQALALLPPVCGG